MLGAPERDRLRADRLAAADDDGLSAVVLACCSAAAFGLLSVAVRFALRTTEAAAETGSLATAFVAFLVTAVAAAISVVAGADLDAHALWPFILAGLLAPGLSQLFFFQAVRDLGSSRTSVIVGIAPLVAVGIALVALGEPAKPTLLFAAVLVVAGSVALGLEPERPAGFRRLGLLLALACTVLFATRDDVLRSLATGTTAAPLPAAAVAMGGGAATLLAYLALRRKLAPRALARSLPRFALPGLLFGSSYLLLFEAYYRGRVTVVSPLVATESLFGVVFSALLLRRSEAIGRHVVLGAVLVVVGAAIIGATR